MIDIAVQFSRDITVTGTPELLLSTHGKDISFTAKYVNVSSIQWMHVENPGYYAIEYNGNITFSSMLLLTQNVT